MQQQKNIRSFIRQENVINVICLIYRLLFCPLCKLDVYPIIHALQYFGQQYSLDEIEADVELFISLIVKLESINAFETKNKQSMDR